ncbi:unnamed protein product, partial [Didymodactylos carnosus]
MDTSRTTTQDPLLPLCPASDIEEFLDFIVNPEAHGVLQAVDLIGNTNSGATTTTNTNSSSIGVPSSSSSGGSIGDNSKQIISNLAREMMESTVLAAHQPKPSPAKSEQQQIPLTSTILPTETIITSTTNFDLPNESPFVQISNNNDNNQDITTQFLRQQSQQPIHDVVGTQQLTVQGGHVTTTSSTTCVIKQEFQDHHGHPHHLLQQQQQPQLSQNWLQAPQ